MAELADLMSKPMRLLVETEQVADAKESIRDFKVFDTYRPSAPLPFILAGGAPYACSQDVDATSKNRTYSLKKETSSQYFNRLKRWRSAARCPTPAAPRGENYPHTLNSNRTRVSVLYKNPHSFHPSKGAFSPSNQSKIPLHSAPHINCRLRGVIMRSSVLLKREF